MISRGMPNKDIQFLFNRPDRPVNSGRITNISKGAYGNCNSIKEASEKDLQDFLMEPKSGKISGVVQVPLEGKINSPKNPADSILVSSLFSLSKSGEVTLTHGENSEIECKASFGKKHSGKWLKAIAGLANNTGGYIFFGVIEKVDLSSVKTWVLEDGDFSQFKSMDSSEFTELIKSTFDPTPKFSHRTISVFGKELNFIYVYKSEDKPVISIRNHGDAIKEGDIIFRYYGTTSRIKYSDLKNILEERDKETRFHVLPMIQQLLKFGPENLMIANLSEGTINDGINSFTISEELLKKIKILKEGSFNSVSGAPALKLIGNVRLETDNEFSIGSGILSVSDVFSDFLNQTLRFKADEYIKYAVENTTVQWFPIRFFAHKGLLSDKEAIKTVRAASASPKRRRQFIERMLHEKAYRKATGTPLLLYQKVKIGAAIEIKSIQTANHICAGIQSAQKEDKIPLGNLLTTLKRIYLFYAENDTDLSAFRRAVCRIDELYF